MKKDFPNKILGIIPFGWKDKGEVKPIFVRVDLNGTINRYISCGFCNTHAHVGVQRIERFYFCPRCLVRLID